VLNTGKKKSQFISKFYDRLVNYTPFLFGALYHLGELISSPKRHSPIYLLNTLYHKSLLRQINDYDPQLIVCPHMFSAHAVTWLLERGQLHVPTVGLITDYTWTPFWEENALDLYIVANQAVADECMAHGIPREKLAPAGIPVGARFQQKMGKAQAREAFGVSGDEIVFGIMGGSMGYGKIFEIAAELHRQMPQARVLAVCGTNQAVFDRVKSIPNVTALGFISNVDVLMDAVDVLLTKPGGLSTTEAMTKRVPLVITNPIPGGEERNSTMLASLGMAVVAKTPVQAVAAARALVEDPAAAARMTEAQRLNCSVSAAQDSGELIMQLGASQNSYHPTAIRSR